MPFARANPGVAVGGDGRVYVFGGEPDQSPFVSETMYVFDPATSTWTSGPDMHGARTEAAGVSLADGRILSIGGVTAIGETADVEAFDPTTNVWTDVAPMPTPCQSVGAATGPDGLVYVVGGGCTVGSTDVLSQQLVIYNPTTDHWTVGLSMPDGRGWPSAAFGADGRLYVYGGWNNSGAVATGFAYDPANPSWTQLPSLPVAMYLQATATLADGSLLAIGGCAAPGGSSCALSSVYAFTLGVPTGGPPPGAPTIASATVGGGFVSLAFTPGLTGGSPTTGYAATCVSSDGGTSSSGLADASPIAVSGLTNGKTYQCTVAASNTDGAGSQSSPSSAFVMPVAPTAPGSPVAVAGNATATLHWTAPTNDGGAPISAYVVTPYLAGVAQPAQTFASAATTRSVSALTNARTYTFRVAAKNGAGTGPQSAASVPIVVGAPTIPGLAAPAYQAAMPGNGSVRLRWTAPAGTNGSAITRYVVTPYVGSVGQTPRLYTATTTTETVTGLTNATTYTFRIAAKNARGIGAAVTTFAVVAGAPTAPTALTATAGAAKVTLHWTAPNNNGAAITTYRVTPYVAGVPRTARVFNSTATTETITGLTPGQTYTFTVVARNSRGFGVASVMSPSATPT
jgi:hypothetical protein